MVATGENQAGIPFFSPIGLELYAYGEHALARWQVASTDNGAPPKLTKLPLLIPAGVRRASIRSNELVSTCYDSVCFMPLSNTNVENARYVAKGAGWGHVSPDGRWLAIKDRRRSPRLRVHQLPEVEEAAWLPNRAEVYGFTFSPRRDELAGLVYSPITGRWRVHPHDLDVNYLLVATKAL